MLYLVSLLQGTVELVITVSSLSVGQLGTTQLWGYEITLQADPSGDQMKRPTADYPEFQPDRKTCCTRVLCNLRAA